MHEPRAIHGKCTDCGNVFRVIELPAPLTAAAEAMRRATCTRCGSTKRIVIARDEEVTNG
ncbi:hypothetical protein [Rhizobium sp. 18065]|uniref:hypothetical protein n=1 Tax=Rhizobium sp. 18065 TaxID=2681411 RepID=UPI0013574691|nr:hypothetical protein [Rhizobium sp. 18065]